MRGGTRPPAILLPLLALVCLAGAAHGVFANRSRMRRHLPPPPPREVPGIGGEATSETDLDSRGPADGRVTGEGRPGPSRRRLSWAELLRRVLSLDARAVTAPALSPARSSPLGLALPEEGSRLYYETDRDGGSGTIVSEAVIRPPPGESESRTGGAR